MSRYLINGDINYSIGILSAARTTVKCFYMLYETALWHWKISTDFDVRNDVQLNGCRKWLLFFFALTLRWFGGADFNQKIKKFAEVHLFLLCCLHTAYKSHNCISTWSDEPEIISIKKKQNYGPSKEICKISPMVEI